MTMKGAKQSEGLNHEDEKEVVVEQWHEWPTSEKSLQSMDDNLTLARLSNTSRTPRLCASSPSSMDKRMSSNEMQYKFSQVKRMKHSAPKSKQVEPSRPEKSTSCKRKKGGSNGLNSPGEVKPPTMIRAEELLMSLDIEFPSFGKLLVRSHVTGCFWMGLPTPFCKSHLPRKDTTLVLENESGEQFETKFIAEKAGLSAGWRKFAVGHKLLEGDALVFQLVEANKFKVYIIRANDLTEVDGALSLLNLDVHLKQSDADLTERGTGIIAPKNRKRKRLKSLSLAAVQKKNKKIGLSRSVPRLVQPAEQSENDSEVVGSEFIVGSKFTDSAIQFRDIKSFKDFSITVNGLCIDSELSEHIRTKYYELCCSTNSFLHTSLLQGLNCALVAGIIFETVNIADAIRSCKFTTSQNEFAIWDKSLKSFELLGMNVGFLRDRLHRLQTLVLETEDALDRKRYIEAKTGRAQAEDEIGALEAKLVELREACEKFDADIVTLKSKAESYELKFMGEANAPW